MPVLLCASQKISSRLLFVCFTSEQRAFPSSHPGAPSDVAIQHNTSASWRCLRTIWFVRNWTECHRNELERKNRERVRNRKKKVTVKSPSKTCPLATVLLGWNGFSGRRQRFYYSLKCSPMAFGCVWKSHFSTRSGAARGSALSVLSSVPLHFQRGTAV